MNLFGPRNRAFAAPPHIIVAMARGWESKFVEAQQSEADEPSTRKLRLTPEQAARHREKEGLRLSYQRVLQQLESCRDPRHRKVLQDALADLDRKRKDTER